MILFSFLHRSICWRTATRRSWSSFHSWLLACILWRISWTLILECPARFSIAVFIFWLPQLIPCMPNSDFIRLLSSFTCNKCKIRRISRLHIRQLIRPQLPTKLINFRESKKYVNKGQRVGLKGGQKGQYTMLLGEGKQVSEVDTDDSTNW
jgi:hypothetical protein